MHTWEIWSAKSFGLAVREIIDDPRQGRLSRELEELSQDEPNAAMFQPPGEYEIQTVELQEVPCQH
jgi:hypothetical protein